MERVVVCEESNHDLPSGLQVLHNRADSTACLATRHRARWHGALFLKEKLELTVERRSVSRAPGVLDGAWFGSGQRCRITSLSVAGCYIETLTPPTKGGRIRLELQLPQGPLSARAEVIYHEPNMGFAVAFVDLTPEDRGMLAKAVELLTERVSAAHN